jgi:hypothetical protein
VAISLAALVAVCVMPGTIRADTADDVDKIVARASAVLSGRFEYVYNRKFFDSIPGLPAKFSFQGNNWAQRYQIPWGGTSISHNGRFIEYVAKSSHNPATGEISSSAKVGAAQSMTAHKPYPPFFAGTFWDKQTVEYIKKRRAAARDRGPGEIDGLKVRLLEWDVPAADWGDAFVEITQPLRQGGKLRVYVARDLGYVLPKVEHVTPDGFVAASFSASEFVSRSRNPHPQENAQRRSGQRRVFHGVHDQQD